MSENLHAFYSAQMARQYPDTIVYWRDRDGNEIECTCVGEGENHGTNWPDIEDRGEVVEFARREHPALYSAGFGTMVRLDHWQNW